MKYLWSLLFLLAAPLAAQPIDFSGSISSEARLFPSTPQWPGQLKGLQSSVIVEPEARWRSDDRSFRFSFAPFGRYDARDSKRTHWDIREAYLALSFDTIEVLVGIDVVFWGVTESRHLVNIINQTDAVEDVDEEDKLGQPMFRLTYYSDVGTWQVFVMPGFRLRTFPGASGRLRGALPVKESLATFDSPWKEGHPDTAIRYSHVLGDWDVGIYYFYGHSREPRFFLHPSGIKLGHHYDLIHQMGTDIQYTYDAWLWKLEAIARNGHGQIFGAVSGGFEYTIYQLFDGDADLGLVAEGHWDGRDKTDAPLSGFEHDIFLGARLALNDVQSASVLVGTIIDVRYGDVYLFAEAERRLGKIWKLAGEARIPCNVSSSSPLAAVRRDDFINLRLSFHF
jgi:hypothetical protein